MEVIEEYSVAEFNTSHENAKDNKNEVSFVFGT